MAEFSIVHVSAEMAPFAKVGGLGDVVGSLPLAQARAGHRVRVVLPGSPGVLAAGSEVGFGDPVPVAYRIDGFDVWGAYRSFPWRGVEVVALVHDGWFAREGIYGDASGAYADNGLRFGWFSGAAVQACRGLDPPPDVVVCHDWPAAFVPISMRGHPVPADPLVETASVQVIHNLAHQGVFDAALASRLGIPRLFVEGGGLVRGGLLNLLAGAIRHATLVVTVSPTYAREIVWPHLGEGLDDELQARGDDLIGILNGIDLEVWNPAGDPHLPAAYDAEDLSGKDECKRVLSEQLGLGADDDGPLFGIVSRLDPQKGLDLVADVTPWLVERGARLAVLGAGDPRIAALLREAASRWPESVSLTEGFDEPLAHRIYAGADAFLMPSRFEPCGLGQMVALRYGTVPVVRRTGGLADTVRDLAEHPDTGTGFVFDYPDAEGLRWAIGRALELLRGPRDALDAVRRRGMCEDLGWDRSAALYERVLARAIHRERSRVLQLEETDGP